MNPVIRVDDVADLIGEWTNRLEEIRSQAARCELEAAISDLQDLVFEAHRHVERIGKIVEGIQGTSAEQVAQDEAAALMADVGAIDITFGVGD